MRSPPRSWTAVAALLGLALLQACTTLPAEPPGALGPAAAASAPAAVAPAAAAPPDADAAPSVAAAPVAQEAQAERHRVPVPTDLWERLRSGFAMPDLDDDLVRHWEQWYSSRPDYVARMTERGGRYLFHVVEQVQARGMPTELALLPFIESAFNPQAVSSASAAGMWQFIPSTGRAYDLKQNHFRDERRDVLASTEAALDYLQSLHKMFGDWHLALAAYNWGEGRVQRALVRSRVGGAPGAYSRLRMPAETRNYVPKLQAVKNLISRPESFGLSLPTLPDAPQFLVVALERDIDVELAARLAGMPGETFRQYNPQHDKPVILSAGSPQLLLPYDNANRFLRELETYDGPLASWTAWVAPKTLKPADVARRHGIDEDELRRVNRIPPRMLVQAGSTLIVPRQPEQHADDVPEHLADHGRLVLAPDGATRRLVLKAGRRGDSVKAVAHRYRIPASLVAQLNNVAPEARFKPGARIVVMVPAKSVVRSSRSPAKRAVKPAAAKKPAR